MSRYVFAFACGALVAFCGQAAAQVNSAYLIRVADGKPVVEVIPPASFPPPPTARGLLVWSDATGDRWLTLTDDKSVEKLSVAKQTPADGLGEGGFSRGGRGGGTEVALAGLTRTNLIAPANVSGGVRGGEVATPVSNSTVLNTSPIARRLPFPKGKDKKGVEYPAATVELKGENGETRKVVFPAGEKQVVLEKLTPGDYTIGVPGGGGSVKFTVATTEQREAVLGRVDQLAKELGKGDPLVTLYAVETLLTTGGQRNNAPVYLGDALDWLEGTAKAEAPSYLQATRDRLWDQAQALSTGLDKVKPFTPAKAADDPDPTGIEPIDAARAALLAGDYRKADAALETVKDSDDQRAVRLATLYKAVRLGEGGAGADTEAEELFTRAVAEIPEADRGDRFRAHANFALFYHRRAQDRLNNHAFQMAAGVGRTVSAVAADWVAARHQYEAAAKFSTPAQNAYLEIDRARLHALLEDLVRTLDPAAKELIGAASTAADRAAEAASNSADAVSRGIAREIRGQLAFRNGNAPACRKVTNEAIAEFVAAGFLPGAENAHRLLGQLEFQQGNDAAAIRHLTASHLIAELLRDRFPGDKVGRVRAGFFARRAFVLDTLVELHLKHGHADLALELAEAAKGRAFTDILSVDGIASRGRSYTLADVRRDWTRLTAAKPTAAVEYFLGRDRVWAFVVTTSGEVLAVELRTPEKKPVDPRELIALVRHVLGNTEDQARKMANRVLNDEGYDNSWQDDLHLLARILLPEEVLLEMRKAKVVLLAPQHVLHYLPFPALVLEKDAAATPKQLARPKKFLIDEDFVTVNVPSITGWFAARKKPPAGQKAARGVGLVQAPGERKLEGVEKDFANLKEAFGAFLREGDVLREEDATPARASALLNRPGGLLLLATHGYNDADAPLESYLVLYPDDKNPTGRLRAADIYKMNVGADVVIMSSCYTGLGDRSPLPGDDLFGLQRAFLQGGARVVVAGLWDVCDLTAPDLMRVCFTRLAAGTPAAQAVREAQKAFLDEQRAKPGDQPYIHPYFWGVYSVLGDDQAKVGR